MAVATCCHARESGLPLVKMIRIWLLVQDVAGITAEQRAQLVELRQEYLSSTQQTLSMRMQLWRNLRESLASSHQVLMSDNPGMAHCNEDELEVVDALRTNMEVYLNSYAHVLRVWTMVILTPFQVQAMADFTTGMEWVSII